MLTINKINKHIVVIIGILIIATLSGCQASKGTKEDISDRIEKKDLMIVTSFYPIYISTINITKDVEGVEVINMTEPITGCLHDYFITPEDMKQLEEADIFVINGAGMENFMDDVTNQIEDLKIIEASRDIPLIEGDTEEGVNPHVWVSISHAITQVKNIQADLSQIDPLHSKEYEANANEYIHQLEQLKSKMHQELKDITRKDIVTFHEAFPYFAEEFELNVAAVIEREPGSQPSAKELASTIDQIKSMKINALFVEPQYSKKSADTIAHETGATVYTLDPCVYGEMELHAYINTMNKNAQVLKQALQ